MPCSRSSAVNFKPTAAAALSSKSKQKVSMTEAKHASLIQQLNACLTQEPGNALTTDEDSGQTYISCQRDLLFSTVQALRTTDHQEIVKPSAWATRERELIRTIEQQKSQIHELQTKSNHRSELGAVPSPALLESERLVKKLTRERDELLSRVQQLISASKQPTKHHSPATSLPSHPSVNAAAADQAAQSSGLVVVEHLSVSRSRQILQKRVDESKERAEYDKAIRMTSSSGGGTRRTAQVRAADHKEAFADVETDHSSPEKSPNERNPDEIEEKDPFEEEEKVILQRVTVEEEILQREKVEEGVEERAPEIEPNGSDTATTPAERQEANEEAVEEEEEEEQGEEEEESALDVAMRALVAAAEVQQKIMEEEEERMRERSERERLNKLVREREEEEAAAQEAAQDKDLEDLRPTASDDPALSSSESASKEAEELNQRLKELNDKVRVYEATLESMRVTVEEADDERYLLREQNLQLAATLAEMQAFISHRARDKKSSSISLGSWLKKKEKLPVSSLPSSSIAGARKQ